MRRAFLLLPLLPLSFCARADEDIARVDVKVAALQQRRDDTAGRVFVNRDDLLRYGDASLADALRRQPGVTLNGGQVQLRGLGGGRTQFLIDGDPAPPGFSPDGLAPELIERVEILRSASADSSNQGIAGSINVVLRKGAARWRTSATLADERSAAGWSPAATLDLARPGEAWSGTLAAQAARTLRTGRGTTLEQSAMGERLTHERDDGVTERFGLVPRLNWKSPGGATLALQGLLDYARGDNSGTAQETTLRGEPSAYPRNGYATRARTVTARSDIGGTHRPSDDTRLEWKARIAHNQRNGDYRFTGRDAGGAALFQRSVLSTVDDDSAGSSGKLRFGGKRHALAAGWDGTVTRRAETRLQQDSGSAGALPGRLDQRYAARVWRLAMYAQDEWSPTPSLDIYAGLRWEGLRTMTDGRDLAGITSRAGVWSPVAHLLWRLPASRDQLRLALTRSYKAPETRDLVPRRYTVNNANGPTNPDVQGNPALRPELAWGVDIGYEKYLAGDGMLGVSAYARRIDDVILARLFRDGDTWVSTPGNAGQASTRGLEVDGRLKLGAAATARFTLSRNWSHVAAVPGPDNRLGEQTPLAANVGLDYRHGPAITAGFNWNVQAGANARTSATQWSDRGTLRRLDLHGSWQPWRGTTLRATVADLLDDTRHGMLRFDDGDNGVRRDTTGSGSRTLRIAAEFAL